MLQHPCTVSPTKSDCNRNTPSLLRSLTRSGCYPPALQILPTCSVKKIISTMVPVRTSKTNTRTASKNSYECHAIFRITTSVAQNHQIARTSITLREAMSRQQACQKNAHTSEENQHRRCMSNTFSTHPAQTRSNSQSRLHPRQY